MPYGLGICILEDRVLNSSSLFTLHSGTQKQGGTYRMVLSDMVTVVLWARREAVIRKRVSFENQGGNLCPTSATEGSWYTE